MNQDTENLILQELFNLNHKIDNYQESNQRQFEEIRGEIKTIKETMATKDELKALEAKMATKDELKALEAKMATKDELKALEAKMATKDELKALEAKMATKEDLKKFATKEDLKRELDDVSQVFQDTFRELQRRENNLRMELLEKAN